MRLTVAKLVLICPLLTEIRTLHHTVVFLRKWV